MAQENFKQVTEWLLVHEGGFVDDPDDPGGATNKGITQTTYNLWRSRKGLALRSVRNITEEEVWDIYKSQYWDTIQGDLLPSGLDYAVYDFAVNSGPSRAVRFLQELLKVTVDGIIGNETLSAIQQRNDIEGLIQELCKKRLDWMKTLRTFKKFGRGWTIRVMGNFPGVQPNEDSGVVDRAIMMSRGAQNIPMPVDEFVGKAEDEDLKVSEQVKDGINFEGFAKAALGSIPGFLASAAVLPQGPLQWAVSGIAVMAAIVFTVYVVRKIQW